MSGLQSQPSCFSSLQLGRLLLRLALPALVLALWVSQTPSAAAQQINVDQFRLAETPEDGFALSRPIDRGHLKFAVNFALAYANDPLVFEQQAGDRDSESFSVIEHHLAGHLMLSLGLWDRLVVYAGLPAVFLMDGNDAAAAAAGVPTADGAQIGDPRFGLRLRILGERDSLFGLAVQAGVTAPLARAADSGQNYSGEEGPVFLPKIIAEVRPSILRFTANVGARVREDQFLGGLDIDHEFTWGLGAGVAILPERLFVMAEFYGANAFKDFGSRELSAVESLFGVKWLSDFGLVVGAAAGPGLTRGYGSPDVRAVLNLGYAMPVSRKEAPQPAPAPVDSDGDGILDDVDRCPNKPEDKDGFEDEDGCPDLDNDQDSVPDTDDQCAEEAEDKDGFEDEDGCPDLDNDQDGVPDTDDQCAEEAEDKDGFEDEDGCPDLDNDQDGVPDAEDECPVEPGLPETKGCPKAIRVEEGQIKILQKIEFATGKDKLKPSAEAILAEVKSVLAFKTQIKQVRVEGHTDSKGSNRRNLKLSKSRAAAVRAWLVEHGIASGRLSAYGCGEERPIESNRTRGGRQKNRRVEFHITDPAPKEAGPSTDSCELADD